MQTITPILLCGGSGTRLWPLSRQGYPKQFVPLAGTGSLFQQSAERLSGRSRRVCFAPPVVVTGTDFRFVATEQLAEIGIEPGAVLLEPEGRNTAPAVLAAALHLAARDPEALMLIAPADHLLPDRNVFRATVARALPAALSGQIVLFGIKPDRPETGYGYLELSSPTSPAGSATPLSRFVEKPDVAEAARMLASGRFLWNSGLFLFRACDILAAFLTCAPELLAPVRAALAGARTDLGFLRLDPEPWASLPDISIDYAVMEKADSLAVVRYCGKWSDLGGWDAVWREALLDPEGNATSGPAIGIDCTGSLLRSESEGLELVGIGLRDMIAIAMPDAVLVAPKNRAQEVKQAVLNLRQRQAPQADRFAKEHRPWGSFECLSRGDRFQVKRIHVRPGGALSLQSHAHRAEHWVVVEGRAQVTLGADTRILEPNESIYVPQGARHRLENPGADPVILIEVQTGDYLGEDDIIRYDDVYAR